MRNKVASRGKSKSEALPAKGKAASEKKSKKPKATKGAKEPDAGKGPTSDSTAEFQSSSTLLELKEDAVRIDAEISRAVQGVGDAIGAMKSKHALIEDFIDRELWRYLPIPGGEGCYKHETAWKKDKANLLGSASMLFNVVSGYKALKGETTQEQREQMGPRKRALATSARKRSGKPLAPAIIDAAADPKVTEKELRDKLNAAGHGPKGETPVVDDSQTEIPGVVVEPPGKKNGGDKADELLARQEVTHFARRKGDSGEVNGKSGTAEKYDSVIRQAIAAYSNLYAPGEDISDQQAIKAICGAWLNAECLREGLADMTNIQAFDHLEHESKAKAGASH